MYVAGLRRVLLKASCVTEYVSIEQLQVKKSNSQVLHFSPVPIDFQLFQLFTKHMHMRHSYSLFLYIKSVFQ